MFEPPSDQVPDLPRILLVDDQPEQLRIMATMLRDTEGQVVTADSGQEALDIAVDFRPHYVISDIRMPGMDGLQVCEHVRRLRLTPYPHITLVSADVAPTRFSECLNAGADLFLPKPFGKEDLLVCLNSGRRLHDLHRQIERSAHTDQMTGLPTRSSFELAAEREFARSRRHGVNLSCALLDVDFFKRINDTYGHAVGDAVLASLGETVLQSLRGSDLPCRFGGEEICMLFPETDEWSARRLANRIHSKLNSNRILAEQIALAVTVSIGVAELREEHNSVADLIAAADESLLVAKGSGRNRVVSYSEAEAYQFGPAVKLDMERPDFWSMSAGRVMTTLMATLDPDESLRRATELFLRFRVNAAPVVRDGKLLGILSEKDVMQMMYDPQGWEAPVHEAMNPNVICFEETDPIKAIHEFFCRMAIHRVVITRKGLPVGIVARGTILRAYRNWRVDGANSGRFEQERLAGEVTEISQVIAETANHIRNEFCQPNRDYLQVLLNSTSRIQEMCKDLLSAARDSTSAVACECVD